MRLRRRVNFMRQILLHHIFARLILLYEPR
jgi:hypothetical protein